MGLWIQESYTSVEEVEVTGYAGWERQVMQLGESHVYETFTDSPGELFKSLRREWGRCVSSIYIDRPDGNTLRVGWVFQARVAYEDDPDQTYIREVWCTLFTTPPTVTIKRHYITLERAR